MRYLHWFVLPLLFGLLTACSSVVNTAATPKLEAGARWAILPLQNHTETPQAGQRAEAIVESLMRIKGVNELLHYPPEYAEQDLLQASDGKRLQQARQWAMAQGARYAIGGTVDEWRYKVGIDGEPAVGITLSIIDLKSGRVLWSAVGSKSGWSRQSLNGTAQALIHELLSNVTVGH